MAEHPALADPARSRGAPASRAAVLLVHLGVAAAMAGAAACAAPSSSGNPFEGGAAGSASALRIEVRNLHFNDATLHAVSSGSRYRLGTVSGKSDATYEVPWQGQQSVRIEIDLLAGDRFTTRPVSVTPGDRVELYIQPELRRSYLQR